MNNKNNLFTKSSRRSSGTHRARIALALPLLLTCALLASLLLPDEAQAQCNITGGPSAFTDANGFIWQLNGQGGVRDGGNASPLLLDPFIYAFSLGINGAQFPTTLTPTVSSNAAAHNITYGPAPMSGLNVTRKLYISRATTLFTRYIEEFQNPTAAPIEITVQVATNLNYADVQILNTGASSTASPVNTVLDTGDNWAIYRDSLSSSRPYVSFVFGGTGRNANVIDAVELLVPICQGLNRGLGVTYTLTVPPGRIVRLMHIAQQHAPTSSSSAPTLAGSTPTSGAPLIFTGISDYGTLSTIANWRWSLVGTPDTYTALEDTPLTIAAPGVFANDLIGSYGTSLQALASGTRTGGTVTITNTTGGFTFTPTVNFNGAGGFDYLIYKSFDGTDYGLGPVPVTVNVTPVNDKPTFSLTPSTVTVNEDAGASSQVVISNFNPGPADEAAQTATYTVSQASIDPTLSFSAAPAISANGTVTFTPAANAFGSATLSVTARDSGGTANGGIDTSDPRTLTITVTAINDAPTFTAANPPESAEDAGTQLVNGWVTAFNPGVNESTQVALSYAVTGVDPAFFSTPPAVSSAGMLSYITAPNVFGSTTFTVTARDNGGTANGGIDTSTPQTFTLTITPVNDAPVAFEDSYETPQGAPLTIAAPGVLANDTDIEGDALSAVIVDQPANGSVTLNPNGGFTFTPANGFAGTTSFTYQASDGQDASATRSVTIRVIAVCGDGVLFGDETCDDGNTANGDGCSALCAQEPGWACDDSGQSCQATCGDGTLDANEACDDANVSDADGCSASCDVEVGFTCARDADQPDACAAICGDGLVLGDETCDDANTTAGDSCSPTCAREPGWVCDANGEACQETCGDGLIDANEACDDANLTDDDGCTASCAISEGWRCVRPNDAADSCAPICGDGLLRSAEACDDANLISADGCTSECAIEDGYGCSGEPSACVLIANCGNASLDQNEACDDGNVDDADGCSALCAVEDGWRCDSGAPSSCEVDPGDTSGGDTSGGDTSGSDASGGDASSDTAGATSDASGGDAAANPDASGGDLDPADQGSCGCNQVRSSAPSSPLRLSLFALLAAALAPALRRRRQGAATRKVQ
jgi:MYXO-CTERM domain-containing protein